MVVGCLDHPFYLAVAVQLNRQCCLAAGLAAATLAREVNTGRWGRVHACAVSGQHVFVVMPLLPGATCVLLHALRRQADV